MRRSTSTSLIRTFGVFAVSALLLVACGRSDDPAPEAGDGPVTTAESDDGGGGDGGGDDRLGSGGFGELADVCGEGDGAASGTGVDGDTMKIGVVSDKGAELRPGLNEEMYDIGIAFADWCNEQGGINGLKIEISDRDAKLFDFPAQVEAGCDEDFAFVGGGAALDDKGHDRRADCGLPNFAGYTVSDEAREAGLTVAALPAPSDKILAGSFKVMHDLDPDIFERVGTFATDLPSVSMVVDQDLEAIEALGGNGVYANTYSSLGETNWRPFVQAMKNADLTVLDYAGEQSAMISLDKAFEAEGWRPKFVTMHPNMYDARYIADGGDTIGDVLIRTTFFPVDMPDDSPAIQDYLSLLSDYGSKNGKPAMLGQQALSSWLLFAHAVKECGTDVTRECVVEKGSAVDEWNGGGLHGPTSPAENTPTPCFMVMTVEDGEFTYSEEFTAPNDGLWNCDPANQFTTTVQDD